MNQALSSIVSVAIIGIASSLAAQESPQVDFVKDIKPILEKRCIRCHSDPDPKEGIYLEAAGDVIDSYVFANDPDGSDFYQRMVTEDPELMMPPPEDGGPIPRQEALMVRLWISEGAEWPEDVKLERPSVDEPTTELPDLVLRVDFERDVKPILEEHCIECHGRENPADGIDFTTRTKVLGEYVLPHEPLSSSLFTRIISEDAGKVMPPPAESDPLSASEQFVIRLWIDEGASWPSEITLGEVAASVPEAQTMAGKIWTFQGYFHPAAVHFPVALLSIAALFVVLHWLFGGGFRDAAFYCLTFGALSAVVASIMGWALSPTTGYGDAPFDSTSASFWHRWSGVAVSVLALIVAIMAIRARKAERARRMERARKELPWQLGVLLLAVLVGLTGHQGGELTYGEEWYHRAFAMFDISLDDDSGTAANGQSTEGEAGTKSDRNSEDANGKSSEETPQSPDNGPASNEGASPEEPEVSGDESSNTNQDDDSKSPNSPGSQPTTNDSANTDANDSDEGSD